MPSPPPIKNKRKRRKFDERESLAYHEAGHWAVATAFRVHVYEISIVDDGRAGGHMQLEAILHEVDVSDRSDQTRFLVEKYISIHFAGYLAQKIHFPSRKFDAKYWARTDLEKLFTVADRHYEDREKRDCLRAIIRTTRRLLRSLWPSIEKLAQRLLVEESGTLHWPVPDKPKT